MTTIIIDIIFGLGVTLGVGSSTYALVFFVQALRDGAMDASERAFLHTVFTILRIGMVLIAVGLAGYLAFDAVPETMAFMLQCILTGIIAVNAILMDRRIMPMKFGPIIAGGSWYSLFFTTKLPVASVSLWTAAAIYVIFLIVFYVVFHSIRKALTLPKPESAS